MKEPPHPVLAVGRVRHVGDPVAVVIGESLGQARDAAELIAVDYAVEPAVVDVAEALKPGAPQVWRDAGARQYLLRLAPRRQGRGRRRDRQGGPGRQARPDQQPAGAERDGAARRDRRVRPRHRRVHALHDQPEPARDPAADGRLRAAHPGSASCASSRRMSAAASARRSTITPRRRSSPGPPARCGKPIKWTAERSESFMSDAHGRDHVTHVELALDADGKFTGAARSRRSPIWAPICRPSRPASRPISTARCSPAPTRRRRSTARSRRCSPTPCRSMPIAAPGGRRRRSCWSASSMSRPTNWASTRPNCAGATSSRPTPSRTRRRSRCNTTAATTRRRCEMALQAADYAGFEARRQEAAARGK